MLPALHRAASLLRCCRADSLLPLHSPSPSRMRLNQSLLFSSPLASVSVSVSVPVPVLSLSLSLSRESARFLQSRMVESKTTLCFVTFGWLLV